MNFGDTFLHLETLVLFKSLEENIREVVFLICCAFHFLFLSLNSQTKGALSIYSVLQARNAAIVNSYFVGSINRVGTEIFPNLFTSANGKPPHANFGHFYGSSHFSAPDASCTPSLSRHKDGLMISDMDLNLCRQLKDKWGFRMTGRYELYADLLANYVKPDFEPQVISDPLLHKNPSQVSSSKHH